MDNNFQNKIVHLFNTAIELQQAGNWKEAINAFGEIIQLAPSFAPAYVHRGLLVHELGKPEIAYMDFERAIEINPAYGLAYYGRGWFYHTQGNFAAELADAQKGLSLDEQNQGMYYRRIGAAYHGMKRFEEAINAYRQAIQMNGTTDEGTIYNRGLCYAEMGQHTKAVEDFTRALELDPDWAWALWARAMSNEILKNHRAVLTDYQNLIHYHPNHPRRNMVRHRIFWLNVKLFIEKITGKST
jgi:tetratricopeptide (TPR) repeat protein